MMMPKPRVILVSGYLMFTLAGLAFMLWMPTVGLRGLLGPIGFVVWNLFLILGGALGMFGAGYKQWRIEVASLFFLITGIFVYAISIAFRIPTSESPGGLAGISAIFLGTAIGLSGRGWELVKAINIAGEVDRRTSDG